jgi:FAD binding domain
MSIGVGFPIDIKAFIAKGSKIIFQNPTSTIWYDTVATDLITASTAKPPLFLVPPSASQTVPLQTFELSPQSSPQVVSKAVLASCPPTSAQVPMISSSVQTRSQPATATLSLQLPAPLSPVAFPPSTGTSSPRLYKPAQFRQLTSSSSHNSNPATPSSLTPKANASATRQQPTSREAARSSRIYDPQRGREAEIRRRRSLSQRRQRRSSRESPRSARPRDIPAHDHGLDPQDRSLGRPGQHARAHTAKLQPRICLSHGRPRADQTPVSDYSQFGFDVPLGANSEQPVPHPPLGDDRGPYWALGVQPSITFTYGGVNVKAKTARAKTAKGEVIEGLYVVGMDVGEVGC